MNIEWFYKSNCASGKTEKTIVPYAVFIGKDFKRVRYENLATEEVPICFPKEFHKGSHHVHESLVAEDDSIIMRLFKPSLMYVQMRTRACHSVYELVTCCCCCYCFLPKGSMLPFRMAYPISPLGLGTDVQKA